MVSFDLNKDFYNLQAIRNTIKAYKKLADFKVRKDKKTIKVIMKNIDKEVENVIEDEFCNYVLAEMKNG